MVGLLAIVVVAALGTRRGMGSKEPTNSSHAGRNKSFALNGVALLAELFLEMMIGRYFTVVKTTLAHDGTVCMEKIKTRATRIMSFTEPD